MCLLEAPGPKATPPQGSGFVSADNDDQTAKNMWTLLREAEIDRGSEYVAWNVVPWYLGDGARIREARTADLSEAREATETLLSLPPDLGAIVLLGKKASLAWRRLGFADALEAPHPSPRNLNGRPWARAEIQGALIQAKERSGRR